MRWSALVLASCLVWVSASPASAQCAGGRVVTPATAGRCCWPGQSWSNAFGRCEGPPVCPAGAFASGDDCVAGGAPSGAVAVVTPGMGLQARTYQQSIVWMIVTGSVTWGLAYVLTIAVTAAVGAQGYEIGINAIPLAGPWVCLGACDRPDDYAAALVGSGLLQITGLTLLILGAALHETVTVYADAERPAWAVLPWATAESGGLALTGRW